MEDDAETTLAKLRQAVETLKADVDRLKELPPNGNGDQGGENLIEVVKEGNAKIAEILQEAAARR